MNIAICDYEGPYSFPPKLYGGIERWLWALSKASVQKGYSTYLIGPKWDNNVIEKYKFKETLPRIESSSFSVKKFDKFFDIVFFGHEYLNNKKWRTRAKSISQKAVTFQHSVYQYTDKFDTSFFRINCFSNEMMELYGQFDPSKNFSSGVGYNENPILNVKPQNYLLCMSRVDKEKSPHLAINISRQLNIPLKIVGPITDKIYFEKFIKPELDETIQYLKPVGGIRKMNLIANSKCFIYTKSREYIEPGALIFSEVLKCGVPIVGTSYNGKDCCFEVINSIPKKLGRAYVGSIHNDSFNKSLSKLTIEALNLDRKVIYNIANKLFSIDNQLNNLISS